MELRLERIITKPGLISTGKTYTLVLEGDSLYVVHLGRSSTITGGRNAGVAGATENLVIRRNEKKLEEAEARMASTPLSALAAEKHGALLQRDALEEVATTHKPGASVLVIKSGKFKKQFIAATERKDELDQFAAALRS